MSYEEVIRTVDAAIARAKKLKLGAVRVKEVPDNYIAKVGDYVEEQGHLLRESEHYDGVTIYINTNNRNKL
jgi:hypothetical protein